MALFITGGAIFAIAMESDAVATEGSGATTVMLGACAPEVKSGATVAMASVFVSGVVVFVVVVIPKAAVRATNRIKNCRL